MKKRILKIAALVFAIVLIGGVCIFANGLVGNPISKAVATNTAEKHLEETYADKDFEIERVFYSFKDGYYHAGQVKDGKIGKYHNDIRTNDAQHGKGCHGIISFEQEPNRL